MVFVGGGDVYLVRIKYGVTINSEIGVTSESESERMNALLLLETVLGP